MTVQCPTTPTRADGTPHTIQGCGSNNVVHDSSDPGVWDCLDCGIFFQPHLEQTEATPPDAADGAQA